MKRRIFIKNTMATATGAFVVPTIVPSSVFGKNAPSKIINVGQIGYGRIGKSLDVGSMLRRDDVRVVAVSDVDSKRLNDAKETIEARYNKDKGKSKAVEVKIYEVYREMLLRPDIDAVVISTPDHWHAQPALEAALAGKDFFLQKPTTLTIAEGKLLRDTVAKKGTITQICTQHRCSEQFWRAAELIRNGRIGKLHTVYIGIGGETPGPVVEEMPIPKNLNYDMWLGSTPWVFYNEIGVHPQNNYGRPGWMKRHQFGAGGITNTGQHYIDVAAWAMNTERTSPIQIEAVGQFPKSGIFDVPNDFMVIAEYQNGIRALLSNKYPAGARYEGSDGWIYAGPGSIKVTESDPDRGDTSKIFDASNKSILESKIGDDEIRLLRTNSLHDNWIDCVKSREQTLVPIEVAHRSCSVALLGDIAMRIGRRLKYDPAREQFIGDEEANGMIFRTQREPYETNYVKM